MKRAYNMNNVCRCTLALLLLLAVQAWSNGECYAKDKEIRTPAWYQTKVRDILGSIGPRESTMNAARASIAAVDSLTKEALEKYPNNSIAHELRGRYYLFLANRDGGIERREGAFPTSRNLEDYKKARYHFVKALSLDKGNISARQQMLKLETDTGEYSSALIYCNELLEVAPYDAGLWKKKIDLYRKVGNDIEADRLAQRYMSIYTNDTIFKLAEADHKESNLNRHGEDKYGYYANEKEATLREMIELHPNKPIYYYYLVNHLSSKGRPEEALEVAGTAIYMCKGVDADREDGQDIDYKWFVDKRVRILCDLNRTKEAENYLLNMRKEGYSNESLLSYVRLESARASKMNDPYEAYAYIYDKTGSQEAFNYLINTAIQRGYYDDALAYIKKVKNPGWQTRQKEYTVHKRMGNTSKAYSMLPSLLASMPKDDKRHDLICDLMQFRLNEAKDMMSEGNYRRATTPLVDLLGTETVGINLTADDDILDYYEAAWSNLYTCYMNTKQYEKASEALNVLYQTYRKNDGIEYTLRRADLYYAGGKQQEALDLLSTGWKNASNADDEQAMASAYEEYAIPYIKSLIDTKQIKRAEVNVKQALEIRPADTELLTYGINTAQTLNDKQALLERLDLGLYADPCNRNFIVKKAQYLQANKNYEEAISTIEPLFDTYYGDSTIIGVYAENNYFLMDSLLINNKGNAGVLAHVNNIYMNANKRIAGNTLLIRSRGRYYEALAKAEPTQALRHKASADSCYRLCKNEFDSPGEYRFITNQLYYDSRHNELSFEYQHGVSGEDASRSGTAYMSYKRITNRGDEMSLGLAYAGRSGLAGSDLTDYTKGGIGYQVSAGWSHNFCSAFTGEIQAAWASHYFPTWTAKVGATWHLPKEWDMNLHASYRNIETYSGVYKRNEHSQEFEIDHWNKSNTALFQFGTSVSKMINEQFRVSVGSDGFLMDKDIFVNGNAKCQFYPLEGSKNHFFVSGGIGTAPDGSMLDKAHTVTFRDLNGFMSMGGYILLTRNIGLGLSGTWNTIYVQTERPSTSMIPIIRGDYRNYFYVNANVSIKF